MVRHDAGMVAFASGMRTPFFRYWLSGFLSDFGDGVRLAAFPLLAAQITRSPVAVAAVTAVQGLPWLLLGGGLGVIVDRTDRRRLMLIVDIARAVIIAALVAAIFVRSAGLLLIYLTAFVTGVGSALRDTAAVTCVPRLVKPADLDQANGRVTAGQIVGNELAGPAAGGWLFGLAAVLPFAVNEPSTLPSAASAGSDSVAKTSQSRAAPSARVASLHSARHAFARSSPIAASNMRIAERIRRNATRAWCTNSGAAARSKPSSFACRWSSAAATSARAAGSGPMPSSRRAGEAFTGRSGERLKSR